MAKRATAARAAGPNQPWPSSRLAESLRQAFQQGLKPDVNIQIWRYAKAEYSRPVRKVDQSRDSVESLSCEVAGPLGDLEPALRPAISKALSSGINNTYEAGRSL